MSEDVLLVVDFNVICRFCLQSKGALTGIFNEEDELSLQFQIEYFTDVEIQLDDRLPNKICHRCRYKIELCYQFKEMILQSHKALIENINEEESTVIEEKFDISLKHDVGNNIVSKFKEAFMNKNNDKEFGLCESELIVDNYSAGKNSENELNMIILRKDEKTEYMDEDISKYLNLNPHDESNDSKSDIKLIMHKKRVKQYNTEQKNHKPSVLKLNEYPTMSAANKKNQCLLCLEKCADVDNLHKHVDNHIFGTNLEPYYKFGERNITCRDCNKFFKYRFNFITHQRQYLNIKPFLCQYEGCDGAFYSNSSLRQHLPIHADREFICSVCALGFKRKSDLKGHEIIHKDAGKLYHCPVCNLTCKNRLTLAAHVKKHGTQPAYKCSNCPKTYFSRSELERHTHRHSPEKRFRCSQCPGAYYSRSALARHERGHRRIRPPRIINRDLRRHTLQDYPFSCPHCQKGYFVKSSLNKHMALCELVMDQHLTDAHPLNNDTFIQIEDSLKVYHEEQILNTNEGDQDLIVELIDVQMEDRTSS